MQKYILIRERLAKPEGHEVVQRVADTESLLRFALSEYMMAHGRDEASRIFWEEFAGDMVAEARCNAELAELRTKRGYK